MVLTPPYIVRLGNLNYNMKDEHLHEYFGELGIVKAWIATDETGRSKGWGFIEFQDRNGVENALLCNGSDELFMERPFQITIPRERRDAPRYGFGPGPGEQSTSFSRPPRSSFEQSKPSGPPSLGLKPRSADADAKARDPSPKKRNLSEDPFGGAALDSEKFKQRQQKEQEREEKQKAELEQIKANREKEIQEKAAKLEEEKKKKDESWRLERQAREQERQNKEEAEKKRKEKEADTGPDNWRAQGPAKTWNTPKPQVPPPAIKDTRKEEGKKYGGGIGRGQDSGFKSKGERGGDFRPRGGDFKPRGGERGGRGGDFKGQGKHDGRGSNKSAKAQPESIPAEDGGDTFQTPNHVVKKPAVSYKAALAQDQTATVNPFSALQKDTPEEGEQ